MLFKLRGPSWFGYHTAITRGKGYYSNLNLHEEKYNQKLKKLQLIQIQHYYYVSPSLLIFAMTIPNLDLITWSSSTLQIGVKQWKGELFIWIVSMKQHANGDKHS